MSSLSDIDKRYLESILETSGGLVLDYNDATFGELSEATVSTYVEPSTRTVVLRKRTICGHFGCGNSIQS